jgi:hypothetical protein
MRPGPSPGHHPSSPSRALLALVLLLLALLPLAGCADSSLTAVDAIPRFVIEVSGEEFRVQVTDPAAVADLQARMLSGERGPVSGELLPGNGGFNHPWGWHLDPTTIHVPDLTMELCDGRPSMVQDALGYWFDSVGRFCPWGAKVVRREY